MAHWLVKSEASAYSWSNLVADGRTSWDGVRNFQARNNLAAMRNGDSVLFYHSVDDKEVVGIARVIREAYPDATADEEGWLAVEIEPAEALSHPVSLERIKSDARLRDIALVRQGRLSVMPVTAEEYRAVLSLAETEDAKGAGRKVATGDATKAAAKRTSKPAKRAGVKRSTAKSVKASKARARKAAPSKARTSRKPRTTSPKKSRNPAAAAQKKKRRPS